MLIRQRRLDQDLQTRSGNVQTSDPPLSPSGGKSSNGRCTRIRLGRREIPVSCARAYGKRKGHLADAGFPCGSGMKTIYIKRATEDVEDPVTRENADGRFDAFVALEEGGLVALAEKFGL